MENALSPAEAVNVWPSILNSMLMAVCPMPLDGRGAAEGIQVLAELDEGEGIVEVEEVEVGVVADVVAMVSGKAVYEVSAGDARHRWCCDCCACHQGARWIEDEIRKGFVPHTAGGPFWHHIADFGRHREDRIQIRPDSGALRRGFVWCVCTIDICR